MLRQAWVGSILLSVTSCWPVPRTPDHTALERGRMLLKSGEYAKAVKELKACVARDPARPPARFALADAYLQRGYPEDAIRVLTSPPAKRPLSYEERDEFHRLLGLAYLFNDELERSHEQFMRMLCLSPSRPCSYLLLAAMATARGNPDGAITQTLEALALDPASADAHYFLGLTYSHAGRLVDAQYQFERVVELREGHIAARMQLAAIHERRGRLDLHYQESKEGR